MLQNNLKIAFRNLLRRRTFSAINIAGLGLGMSAAIFAFLWVQNEFSFDRYHRLAERLYRVNMDLPISADDVWHWAATPLPFQEAMRQEVPEVLRTAAMKKNPWQPFTVRKNAAIFSVKDYAFVNGDWFNLLDYQFIDGSSEGFQQHLHSAILTRDFAQKLFGRTEVLGETFHLDSVEFAVQAVVENPPTNSSFSAELMLPQSYLLSVPTMRENEDNWNNYNFLTFVELRPDTDLKALGEKMTALLRKNREDDESTVLTLQPLSEMHFDQERSYEAMLTGNRSSAYTFGLIGLVILFLACINYVSLSTAQAGTRTKEVGVRKIIGAGGSQIFRLLFAESLLTGLFSLLLALCVVQVAMPFFNALTEKNFRLDPTNPAVWMVTGSTLLAALLLAGVYPALSLTGFSPGSFLRGQNFLKMKNTGFRKGLVVTQFAITTGLIIGAMVIFQQQDYIRQKDLGFDRSHVFEFTVPCCDKRQAAVRAIHQALSTEPSVHGMAASNSSLVDVQSTHSGSIDFDGKPDDFTPTVSQLSVNSTFADVMQLPLAAGRWFQPGQEAELNHVVLNETAVRNLGLKEPAVGQNFEYHGRKGQVIGVLKDFHFQHFKQKIGPLVVFMYPPSNGNFIVKTSAGKAPQALAAAERAWSAQYPDRPFEYRFMDETFDRMYRSEQKNAGLFRVLAGLAVFISCLGLFGLAVFSTEQRRKEIGVRKVLGASVASVVGLLSKDFVKLVFVALLIASPIAYWLLERWLQDFAYHIDIHWTVFALAGLLAVAVAFLTVSTQSIKAALDNPVQSLRNE